MATRFYLLFFFLGVFQNLSAQKFLFSKDYWHEGEVRLVNGEVYQGLLKYNLEYDMLELKIQSKKRVLSNVHIAHFSFKDTLTHRKRVFYALPFNQTSGVNRPTLFEVLTQGDVTLLTREKIIKKPANKGIGLKGSNQTIEILQERFYLLDKMGKIKPFKDLTQLANLSRLPITLLKNYVKQNNSDITQRSDMRYVVEFCNTQGSLQDKIGKEK
ncbi:MAG: hypothetical protein SFU27_07825 [Thermonemataceae bacterium]|nr:hypothetical protein [Thermonemataceae bacterium]